MEAVMDVRTDLKFNKDPTKLKKTLCTKEM